jgi:hypothetical protein
MSNRKKVQALSHVIQAWTSGVTGYTARAASGDKKAVQKEKMESMADDAVHLSTQANPLEVYLLSVVV